MAMQDDDLRLFEAHGAPPLATAESGYVIHDGIRIWYSTFGAGPPVVLLHGGLGHSGNWGYQVPFLLENGLRAVVIDSRGHGRSTRDQRPYSYELMASDVVAVMDELLIENAFLAGWSDGACIAMILGATFPSRVSAVFFFACNMDPTARSLSRALPFSTNVLLVTKKTTKSCHQLRSAFRTS
jgi:pimeloyl-ACP methyl ester carboxylesterase